MTDTETPEEGFSGAEEANVNDPADIDDILEEANDHAGYDGRGDGPDAGRTDDR